MFDAITHVAEEGDEVRLVGFGTFIVAQSQAAAKGATRAPASRSSIPASKQPKFKAGKALKDAVN